MWRMQTNDVVTNGHILNFVTWDNLLNVKFMKKMLNCNNLRSQMRRTDRFQKYNNRVNNFICNMHKLHLDKNKMRLPKWQQEQKIKIYKNI